METCVVCGEVSSKRCSSCHEANYCSGQHQREDWKNHKKVCLPFKVVEWEGEGRVLVASRDLEETSLILQELPVAFAPYHPHPHPDDPHGEDEDAESESESESESVPVCLACSVRMSAEPSKRCSKCNWPLCCRSCEKMKQHAEGECGILRESKINFPPKNKCGAVYSTVLVLRLLLQKSSHASTWRKLMELEHHEKLRRRRRKLDAEYETIVENLVEIYKSKEALYAAVSRDELRRLISLVLLNPFYLSRREETARDKTFLRAIYLKGAVAPFRCIPNATWSVGPSPNFQLSLRASVRIERGAVIGVPLSGNWMFEGTIQRQLHFFDEDKFTCTCARCLDPTEAGSYLSAIKCNACATGYLLPLNPLDFNAEALWRCESNSCEGAEEQEKIMSILHYFQMSADKVVRSLEKEEEEEEEEKGAEQEKKGAEQPLGKKLDKLDETLTQFSESRLHRNHFILRSLENIFIHQAFGALHTLTFHQIDRMIYHTTHFLNVSNILCPGFNSHLAMLRNCLSQVMLEKKLKAGREGRTEDIFISPVALLDYLKSVDDLQKGCLLFYERDPQTLPSGGGKSSIVKKLMDQNKIVTRDIKCIMSNLIK